MASYLLVESYAVRVLTRHTVARQLFLRVKYPEGGTPGGSVELRFVEGAVPSPNPKEAVGGYAYYLPLRDFDAVYHILQTEKPVYFGEDRVRSHSPDRMVRIGTFDEPIGEGFEDPPD
ncbi:MAG: hypothetical protein K2X87_26290 [Gemmataceae bacterium]|nr:hypothetical protein [Gemmataceae bacterium]